MKFKDGSFVVLFKGENKKELFLVRRSDYHIWNLTGGGIEEGEKPERAAIREAYEETGFKVELLRKVGVYSYCDKNGKPTRKTHLFEGRVISGAFKPEFLGCLGKWFLTQKLPWDLSRQGREKIRDTQGEQSKPFEKQKIEPSKWENIHLLFLHPVSVIKFLRKK